MIEPPPEEPTLQEAAEWTIRALRDEGLPVLLCGRGALDYLGEHTGSVDVDILIGADFRGALSVLDAYADRGDLNPVGGTSGSVVRYLVAGSRPVDVLDVSSVHAKLFSILSREASKSIRMGTAGDVPAVTQEGYFVLAVMIGLRGFAKEKEDPMWKVREAWELFGSRADRDGIHRMLRKMGAGDALDRALQPP